MLLNTCLIPANPDYQAAISMIPLEFNGNAKVRKAFERYLATTNAKVDSGDATAPSNQSETTNDHPCQLIAAIALSLGFPEITTEALRAQGYLSQGFVTRDMMFLQAVDAWPRIANAIERSNEINSAFLARNQDAAQQGGPE